MTLTWQDFFFFSFLKTFSQYIQEILSLLIKHDLQWATLQFWHVYLSWEINEQMKNVCVTPYSDFQVCAVWKNRSFCLSPFFSRTTITVIISFIYSSWHNVSSSRGFRHMYDVLRFVFHSYKYEFPLLLDSLRLMSLWGWFHTMDNTA